MDWRRQPLFPVAARRDGLRRLLLPAMLAAGLIEEAAERPDPDLDDERRRYYRITPLGGKVLRAETSRVSLLVNAARAKKVRA